MCPPVNGVGQVKTKEAELVGICASMVTAMCLRDNAAFSVVTHAPAAIARLVTGLLKVNDVSVRKEVDKGIYKTCFMLSSPNQSASVLAAVTESRDALVSAMLKSLPEVCMTCFFDFIGLLERKHRHPILSPPRFTLPGVRLP